MNKFKMLNRKYSTYLGLSTIHKRFHNHKMCYCFSSLKVQPKIFEFINF
jgi:hypothetical protein